MNKNGLSNDCLKEIKEQLSRRRKKLAKVKKAHAQHLHKKLPQDSGDAAIFYQSKDVAEAKEDLERDEIILIDQALRRMQEGAFGICKKCSSAISQERLKAVPYAEYCIDCQETVDQQDK